MTTAFLAEDVAREEGYAKALPDGRCMSYPDPLSPFAKALRLPPAQRPKGWQTFSPEPWTIGYGVCGPDVNRSTVWTQPQAYARLIMKLAEIQAALDAQIPWWRRLSDPRQDVLAQMAYQLGTRGLMNFRKALAAMQSQQWALAAAEMLDSSWAIQTPERAARLAQQMHDGVRVTPG